MEYREFLNQQGLNLGSAVLVGGKQGWKQNVLKRVKQIGLNLIVPACVVERNERREQLVFEIVDFQRIHHICDWYCASSSNGMNIVRKQVNMLSMSESKHYTYSFRSFKRLEWMACKALNSEPIAFAMLSRHYAWTIGYWILLSMTMAAYLAEKEWVRESILCRMWVTNDRWDICKQTRFGFPIMHRTKAEQGKHHSPSIQRLRAWSTH